MELISDLNEVTYNSSFKWRVSGLSNVRLMSEKGYVIKSQEMHFEEANADWFLKLSPLQVGESVYLKFKFCVRDDGKDENARYSFKTTVTKDIIESPLYLRNQTRRPYLLEMETEHLLKLHEDAFRDWIILDATCTYKTLKDKPEGANGVFATYDETIDINNVPDIGVASYLKSLALEPSKPSEVEIISSSVTVESETVESDKITDKSSSIDLSSDDSSDEEEIDAVDPKMANALLAKRIRKIYLVKMKQIADTSSRLLLTAAKYNFEDLLSESCQSLAAQLSAKNFVEIWNIATELKADELKKLVVKYIVENRERICYDTRMTSDLMIEVVRAIA